MFNFKSPDIVKKDLIIYNARQKPFKIYGLYNPLEEGVFKRMPQDVANKVSKKVGLLSTNTSGARLRFATDSAFIAIGAIYPPMTFPTPNAAALSAAGSCCFDMYVDGKHLQVLKPQCNAYNGSSVSFDLSDGIYESFVEFSEKETREITLCFPSFVNVSELYIGLEKDSTVRENTPYVNEDKPVLFYGSSITQGACASRAGNIYQNVLSRWLNFDYINLGFSGACKAEDTMIDYLCTLDPSVLVFDYDHNTPSAEFLEKTHLPALRKLRAAHPKIPFILLSKPNQHNGKEQALIRASIIERSYNELLKDGCGPVHFINGQDIFYSLDSEMMTTDNTHPTDLGFYCMAKFICEPLKLYFPQQNQ